MMNLLRTGIEWARAMTRWGILAGTLLLAGCGSHSPTVPTLTGNQGGLLPGMTSPESNKAKPSAPSGYTGIMQQTLPDGHVVARELLNGQLLSETWYSSLRLPERAVYYIDGRQVGGIYEFGTDGKLTKRTYYFVGSTQPERIEEIVDGVKISRFTTYWPNGNLRIVSEAAVPAPGGTVSRVQEWWANGKPKSDLRIHTEFDAKGQPVAQEKQGRQTAWDENGYVLSDLEYDQNQAVYDYMRKKKIGPQ